MVGTRAPGCQPWWSTFGLTVLDLSAFLNWGAHSCLQTWTSLGFYDQIYSGSSPPRHGSFSGPCPAPVCFCWGHLLLPATHLPLSDLTQGQVLNTMYNHWLRKPSAHLHGARPSPALTVTRDCPLPNPVPELPPSSQAPILPSGKQTIFQGLQNPTGLSPCQAS